MPADFLDGSRVVSYNRSQLVIEIGLQYGSNELFGLSRVVLEHGSVHAVVAPNGFGKTSFLSSVTSLDGFPDVSIALIRSDWVRLETLSAAGEGAKPTTELLPLDYLLHTLRQRQEKIQNQIDELEAAMESDIDVASAAERLGFLYDALDSLEESAMHEQAEKALGELGFIDRGLHLKPCGELSGGWLYRMQLASTLLSRPEFLIIDEPSFLDEKGTEWLIHFLQSESAKASNAIVLMVTHKEYLLDALAQQILYISNSAEGKSDGEERRMYQFTGTYESFLHTREQSSAEIERGERAHAVEDATAAKADKVLRKAQKKADAGISKRTEVSGYFAARLGAMMAEQKLHGAIKNRARQHERTRERLEKQIEGHNMQKAQALAPLKFVGESAGAKDTTILSISNMDFDYNYEDIRGGRRDQPLLHKISCSLCSCDRVALIGENGAGKSTFLKLILGHLSPSDGEVRYPHPLRTVYFPQNAAMELVLKPDLADLDVTEVVQKVAAGEISVDGSLKGSSVEKGSMSELQARSHLGNFGLTKTLAHRRVASLSTGERTRLYLALLMIGFVKNKPPNLMILDEITDNLDVDTVDSLVSALSSFEGAVVAVSHERTYFLSRFASQEWQLQQGELAISVFDAPT